MEKKYVKIIESAVPSVPCGRCGMHMILSGKLGGGFCGYKCMNCFNFDTGVRYTKTEVPDN